MEEMTGGRLLAARAETEKGLAQRLGQMLIEFARLDMTLGLCLVWVDAGRGLDVLTPKVEAMSFHLKLLMLESEAAARLPEGSPGRAAYEQWIARANGMREVRNALVHGRWGVSADAARVVNVTGLPTSSGQRERMYTLAELDGMVDRVRDLNHVLGALRQSASL